MDLFDFLHGDIHNRKVAFVTFGWVCSSMPSHAQTCLDLPGVLLGSPGSIPK